MTQPLVTICVPTVSHRRGLLSRLLWSIGEQAQAYEGKYEVLIYDDDAVAYGDKLNALFAEAKGKYVVDCGDDDWVASGFLGLIGVAEMEEVDIDCIGYKILYTENGLFQRTIAHRADVFGYSDPFTQGVTQRCWIKKEIAMSVPFQNHYTADRDWGHAIAQKIGTHTYIDRVLYYYDHWENEMLGTAPEHRPEAWVESNRVGEWGYSTFPWFEEPRRI